MCRPPVIRKTTELNGGLVWRTYLDSFLSKIFVWSVYTNIRDSPPLRVPVCIAFWQKIRLRIEIRSWSGETLRKILCGNIYRTTGVWKWCLGVSLSTSNLQPYLLTDSRDRVRSWKVWTPFTSPSDVSRQYRLTQYDRSLHIQSEIIINFYYYLLLFTSRQLSVSLGSSLYVGGSVKVVLETKALFEKLRLSTVPHSRVIIGLQCKVRTVSIRIHKPIS